LWPEAAAACVSTHDLPPLAGWWGGADITERAALGLIADEAAARTARTRERATLAALCGVPDEPFQPAVAAALHARVAAAPTALLLVQAEDLAGETIGVNLPGTDRERPNWRRRLPGATADLTQGTTARAILHALGCRGAL
jgi:glycogen operon protein